MENPSSKIIKNTRKNILNMSQIEFAKHLSTHEDIKSNNITQGTLSKYENGRYKTPSDILMYCQKLRKEKYSNLDYSIPEIIEKLKKVDEGTHSHSLRAIGVLLDQII